jgi:hypothetical protein
MAFLYIEEFSALGQPQLKNAFIAAGAASTLTPTTSQSPVVNTGATTQSAAFQATTIMIRVHADSICSVKVGGASPTATTSNMRFAANQTEYFSVIGGDKLAVILNT